MTIAANIDRLALPQPADHLLISAPEGAAAKNLVFLGVQELHRFHYKEIRDFGRRALTTVADLQDAREITLTLHGAGYGLDEDEAFDSEVAGVIDALRLRQVPPSLKYVTFAEISPARAERMRRALRRLLPDPGTGRDGDSPSTRPNAELTEHLRSVGYDSLAKRHAFVAMPFNGTLDDHFYYAIKPAVQSVGLLCERVDQQNFTGDVVSYMTARISSSSLLVADVSEPNPNVYLEIGFAWGRAIPTVLLCSNNCKEIAFDIRGQRLIKYGLIRDLELKLKSELAEIIE